MAAEIIGSIAAFCTTVAFLPQAMMTIKTQNTDSISLGMYVIFTFGVLMWLFYGIVIDDWIIIIANIITFALAFSILFIKVRNELKAKPKSE